jgi:proteasome assembly chaperone (PAC2) family protein
MYYVKAGKKLKQDMLILAGDIQPTTEFSTYKFCNIILDILEGFNGKEIIAMGGIGLVTKPRKPRIFVTGNNPEIISKYKKLGNIKQDIYGAVGPIIGVTGLLVGLAEIYEADAVALLAETLGMPSFLGLEGASAMLKLLSKRFGFKFNSKALFAEIEKAEQDLLDIVKGEETKQEKPIKGDINYIG